jgi:hypothetical protein
VTCLHFMSSYKVMLYCNELEKMNAKKGKETDSEQCYFR